MKTVNEIAKITGISRRTIRYYDQIGLLKPTKISESGYRLYDDKALEILQQILIFRELDVPLKDIKSVLDNPNLDRTTLLESHKKLLVLKKNHLTELISLIDKIIKEPKLMIFADFNIQKIEQRLESNLEILKNSAKESYEAIVKECGGDPKQFVKKAIENIRENPEMITTLYGSLDGYYESIGNIEEKLENSEANINGVQDLCKKLFDMKDKDVSCPEVQKIMAELDVFNIKMCGIGFQKAEEYRKFTETKLKSNPNEFKKYKEALEKAVEEHDKLYGLGSHDFYQKALGYYLTNK